MLSKVGAEVMAVTAGTKDIDVMLPLAVCDCLVILKALKQWQIVPVAVFVPDAIFLGIQGNRISDRDGAGPIGWFID